MSSTIYTAVKDLYDAPALRLTLDAAVVGSAELADLFTTVFRSNTVTFDNVSSEPQALGVDGVSFSGTVGALGLSTVLCHVEFVQTTSELDYKLRFELALDWTFGKSFENIRHSIVDAIQLKQVSGFKPAIIATSKAGRDKDSGLAIKPGLNFLAELDRNSGILKSLETMLGSEQPATGMITLTDHGFASIDVQLGKNNLTTVFTDQHLPVSVKLLSSATNEFVPGIQLGAEITLHGVVEALSAYVWTEATGIVDFILNTDLAIPSPAEMLEYLGHGGISKDLPGDFNGGNHVSLTQIRLGIALDAKKLEYAGLRLSALQHKEIILIPEVVTVRNVVFDLDVFDPMGDNRRVSTFLSGEVKIADHPFIASARLPGLAVQASLPQNAKLKLTDMVKHFLSNEWDAPDVTIVDMQVRVATEPVTMYSVSAELDPLTIELGHREIHLLGIGFKMNHVASETTGEMHGGIEIAKSIFHLSADHPEANRGWQFSGRLDEELELSSLIGEVLPADVTLPESLQSIAVSNLLVEWNTFSKRFTFNGDVALKWALDSLGSGPIELDLHLDIQSELEEGGTATASTIASTTATTTPAVTTPTAVTGEAGTHQSYRGSLVTQLDVGNLTFGLEYDFSDDSKVMKGSLTATDGIHIADLIDELEAKFTVGRFIPPGINDVTIKDLQLEVDIETKDFTFSGDVEFELIGCKKTDLKIYVKLLKQDDGSHLKEFGGILTIHGAEFSLDFKTSDKEQRLVGSWKRQANDNLHLASLGESLGISDTQHSSVAPPVHLDLQLDEADFDWDMKQNAFALGAKSANYGEAFFGATKLDGCWGFVFGLAASEDQLTNMGVLGSLEEIDFLPLDGLCLMFSTRDVKKFKLPPMPMFSNGFPILGGQALNIKAGLMVAMGGDMHGSTTKPGHHAKRMKSLHNMSGQDKLLFVLQITTPFSLNRLEAVIPGTLNVFDKFTLGDCILAITIMPEFGLIISGEADVPIEHVTLEATGTLAIDETEAECAFDITASSIDSGKPNGDKGKPNSDTHKPAALPIPMGLKGVKLDEIGVEMGVDFVPPGVNFGLAGKFHIGGQKVGDNQFAFVFEIIAPPPGEPIPLPNPLLLSIFIEHLSLNTIIVAVDGKPSPLMPGFLNDLSITNFWFYWCEEPVILPDGTMSKAGIGFNGFVDLFGWNAHGHLEVSSTKGVDGVVQMDPIHLLDVLKLQGRNTPAVSLIEQKVNGEWVPLKEQPQKLEKKNGQLQSVGDSSVEIRNHEVIQANGPLFEMSTSHSPYLLADVEVVLFALTADMHLEITRHGFNFDFLVELASIARAHINCMVKDTGFSADAEFNLHLPAFSVDIFGHDFNIDLDAGIDLEMDLRVIPPKAPSDEKIKFHMGLQGEFCFEGIHLTMPRFQIDEAVSSLEDLPEKIIGHLIDNADEIFADLIKLVGKVLDEGVDASAHIIKGGLDTADKIFQEADQQADKALDDARVALEEADDKINQAADAANHEIDKLREEGLGFAADILEGGVKAVQAITLEIDHVLEQGIEDVKIVFDTAARIVDGLVKEVDKVVEEAAQLVKGIIDESVKIVAGIAKAAGAAVKYIAEEAVKAVKAILNEAGRILTDIAQAVAQAAKAVWNVVRHY
jgi:hypothetical protein